MLLPFHSLHTRGWCQLLTRSAVSSGGPAEGVARPALPPLAAVGAGVVLHDEREAGAGLLGVVAGLDTLYPDIDVAADGADLRALDVGDGPLGAGAADLRAHEGD